MHDAPTGSLHLSPAKDGTGYYWEGHWRWQGKPVKGRLGRAWVELRAEPLAEDVEGVAAWQRRFRKRRGQPMAEHLTPEAAGAELRRAIKAHAERAKRNDSRRMVPFEEAALSWFEERKSIAGWKPTTTRNYAAMLLDEDDKPKHRGRAPRARIMRAFGGQRIDAITADDVRKFLRSLDKDATLSARSVNAHRTVVTMIFAFAVEQGWRDDNPADSTSKRRESDPSELHVYSVEQVLGIARECEDDTMGTMIVVAATCGLRMGELLELRWKDVDFTAQSIRVARSFSSGLGVSSPKGRKGRSVPLADLPAQALAKLGQRDHLTGKDHLVFPRDGSGAHLEPSTVRTRYVAARDKARAKDGDMVAARFHDLRHVFGSLCAAGGIDLVSIQAMMGHASISTTMRYLHFKPHAEAAARLSAVFTVPEAQSVGA